MTFDDSNHFAIDEAQKREGRFWVAMRAIFSKNKSEIDFAEGIVASENDGKGLQDTTGTRAITIAQRLEDAVRRLTPKP